MKYKIALLIFIVFSLSFSQAIEVCEPPCDEGYKCYKNECIKDNTENQYSTSTNNSSLPEYKLYKNKILLKVGDQYLSEKNAKTVGNFQFALSSVLFTTSGLFISSTEPFIKYSEFSDGGMVEILGPMAIVYTVGGSINLGARARRMNAISDLKGEPATNLFTTSAIFYGTSILTNGIYVISLLTPSAEFKKSMGIINSVATLGSCSLSFVTYFVNRKKLRSSVSKKIQQIDRVQVEPLLKYSNETYYANIVLRY